MQQKKVDDAVAASGGSKNFEKGAEDNLSAPSSFIANAHNEIPLHGKSGFFLKIWALPPPPLWTRHCCGRIMHFCSGKSEHKNEHVIEMYFHQFGFHLQTSQTKTRNFNQSQLSRNSEPTFGTCVLWRGQSPILKLHDLLAVQPNAQSCIWSRKSCCFLFTQNQPAAQICIYSIAQIHLELLHILQMCALRTVTNSRTA